MEKIIALVLLATLSSVSHAETKNLPELLSTRFRSLHYAPEALCQDEGSYPYTISLAINGSYTACWKYVMGCLQAEGTPVSTLIQGARCAIEDNAQQEAHDIFHGSLPQHLSGTRDISALILEFAIFAEYSVFNRLTDQIIQRHPQWSSEQRSLIKGLIEYVGRKDPKGVSKKEILNFIAGEAGTSRDFYAELLRIHRINLLRGDSRMDEAYKFLMDEAETFINPLSWWHSAFDVFYKRSSTGKFPEAEAIYRAFLPYAHPKSVLPTEQNVHDYTQIRTTVCADSMLQGLDLDQMAAVNADWKAGRKSLQEFMEYLEALMAQGKDKSDVHSTYASLLQLKGDPAGARKYYWKSHLACPYNNRSHWGLTLINRQEKLESFPEYSENQRRQRQAADETQFPEEISTYFINWNSLSDASRESVKYNSRIWAPFMKELNDLDYHSYIKIPYELLSETPDMGSLRDSRIGPPYMPTYRFDNRLWDDVRGAGGRTVIADYGEVSQTIHGGFNLLGHEMTHQFHDFLAKRYKSLNDCLNLLYARAKERDVFPDSYAAQNVKEYFAQGVVYYLIPADAPARYGINVSWLSEKDPELLAFIQGLETHSADLSGLSCPAQ